jgi:hypothetical protein
LIEKETVNREEFVAFMDQQQVPDLIPAQV